MKKLINDFRNLELTELRKKEVEMSRELVMARFDFTSGKVKNSSLVKKLRHNLAGLKLVIGEKVLISEYYD